ncbi:MAG TPA: glycosyltransferase family 1 protein [Verrucomicrobiae bacterium]|jgi:glycosyltransferase involved in cell wall biosynthesis|nr:glycosyltransferase family 1 protein [Verrucomicrobiae bacterium]
MIPIVRNECKNELKVLLVGNYPNDGQESMRRFADLLELHLPSYGIVTEQLCPAPIVGRLLRIDTGLGKWLGYIDKFLLFPRRLSNRMRRLDSNALVHICDHSNAIYVRALAGIPHLVTCHDLLAVRSALGEFPGCRVRASGRAYQRWILRGLNAVQRVACISTATRRDLLRLSVLEPRQLSLIYNGLNHSYAPLSKEESSARLGDLPSTMPRSGFILHVGGNLWYKNRLGVIQIYARLREKMPQPPQLVMVGKRFTPEMRRAISTNRLEKYVVELNRVSNEELQALYSTAELLLFPSLEEGFGWPIIEAQACGCPVVIADREPMSEIGGNAAAYFELQRSKPGPLSIHSADTAVTSLMEILLESLDERDARIQCGLRNAARFSTVRMVEGYIALYREIMNTGTERTRAPVPSSSHGKSISFAS